jgi:catalase
VEITPVPDTLIADLLAVLDKLSGGIHSGFRPAHARGFMYAGTFTPSPHAKTLTKTPHVNQPSTPVTVRFSLSAGIPTVADNDPKASSPQGMAVRFHLGDHVHTDIVAHSHNGFPVKTGEEFLEFLRGVAASTPAGPSPALVAFLGSHPAAKRFVEAPKPIPASFARQAFFAVTAFRFTNTEGRSRFGRFRFMPAAGTEFLTTEQAATKPADFLAAEMSNRLGKGPVEFKIQVQLARDGDDVTDSTAVWPDDRELTDFGVLSLTKRIDELAPDNRKVIFDPVPRIEGIDSAGDPLTEVRSQIYLMSGRRRREVARQ